MEVVSQSITLSETTRLNKYKKLAIVVIANCLLQPLPHCHNWVFKQKCWQSIFWSGCLFLLCGIMHAEIILLLRISTGMSILFCQQWMDNNCLWFYRNQNWLSWLHTKKRRHIREALYEDWQRNLSQILLPTAAEPQWWSWDSHHKHPRGCQHSVNIEIHKTRDILSIVLLSLLAKFHM